VRRKEREAPRRRFGDREVEAFGALEATRRRSRVETDREREKRDDNDENRTIRADTSDPNRREVYWMILLAVELGLFLIYFTADLK
jgi:hypothetical protein